MNEYSINNKRHEAIVNTLYCLLNKKYSLDEDLKDILALMETSSIKRYFKWKIAFRELAIMVNLYEDYFDKYYVEIYHICKKYKLNSIRENYMIECVDYLKRNYEAC